MTPDGAFIEAEERRDFFEAQTDEEAQFHDLSFLGIEFRQFVQDLVHALDSFVIDAGDFDGIQFHPFLPASMTRRFAPPGAIHEDAAHDFGRSAEEAVAVLIVLVALAG